MENTRTLFTTSLVYTGPTSFNLALSHIEMMQLNADMHQYTILYSLAELLLHYLYLLA